MNAAHEAEPQTVRRIPAALEALGSPDTGMARQAKTGGVRGPLLIALACSLFFAAAQGARVDARSTTLRDLDASGQLATMSERQIDDEVRNKERQFVVKSLVGAAARVPLSLGAGCLGVLVLAWFLRGKLRRSAVGPVAAAALLPGAVASFVSALGTLRQAAILPDDAGVLPRNVARLAELAGHAIPAPWVKLGNALDFFSLWGALLFAFGLSAAAEVSPRRALVATLVAWVCLRLLAEVGGVSFFALFTGG